jgi:hypothetical protein
MEFKGTKGKWKVTNSIPNGIYDLEGHIEIANDQWSIACVFNDVDEAKANALLISKAPEMLEMLKELRNAILSEDYVRMLANSQLAKELIKEATESCNN